MVITEPHYHLATGKHSKNRGGFYRCPKNKTDDITKACCKHPAYRDSEGKERIFDTRDLIEAGFFPEDSDLTLDQMKEALDSLCMVGTPSYEREKMSKRRLLADHPHSEISKPNIRARIYL